MEPDPNTPRFNTVGRFARSPSFLLTLATAMVGVMVFRADVWMGDAEITGAWISSHAWDNWLPSQCWSIAKSVGGDAAWVYRIWNVLALWLLGLTAFGVAREFLGLAGKLSTVIKNRLALSAGLLVVAHPLAGMSACVIANLDWQLTVLFSLFAAKLAWSFMRRPAPAGMLGMLLCVVLADLCAPTGMLLALGGIWVVWRLAAQTQRAEVKAWATARTGWGTGLTIGGLLVVVWLGADLQNAWTQRSLSQGGTWVAHWLTQGRVFLVQFQSLLQPTHLLPEHQFPWSEKWSDWPAVVGLGVIVLASLVCILRLFRKTPCPLSALVFLALWPTLLLLGWRTTNLLSEIRWCAVLPWAAVLAAWGLAWLFSRWPAMTLPIGWGLPTGLMFLTIGQTSRFADSTTMAAHLLKTEPCNVEVRIFVQEKQASHGNLAAVLADSRPFADAYQTMDIANENDPYGRRYDLLDALRYWVQSERNAQIAMENNYGSEYAQAFAQASTARFITEVQKLALTEPKALPLLSALMPSAAPPEPPKPRTPPSIPGIPGTTAQGAGEDGEKEYTR